MNKFRRVAPVAVAAMIAAAAACGGDRTGTGPQAASVTGIAGDSQTAATGAVLSFPLSFVALGSSGQPAQGVHVTWSATPSGGASFNPATETTDVNGVATTTATLGTVVGSVTIHAAVSGVSDAVYHAPALDPCNFVASYHLGDRVNAALKTTDCNYRNAGWFYDFYQLDLPVGQQSVRISMNSTVFDTWVDFWSGDGPLVGFDDDQALGTVQNSQLDVILPGGSYVIGANSFNQFTTGAYSVSAVARPAGMNGCRQVWVARGVTISDSLTAATDCADSTAPTPHYYDVARIELVQGSVLTISAHSTAINPNLALYRITDLNTYPRSLVAQNDDSASGNPSAFIKFTVALSGPYDILIGSSDSLPAETGAYTFDVSSSTASPRPVVPISRGREGWNGSVLGLPRRAKH